MTDAVFAAILITSVGCSEPFPVIDGLCDGKPLQTIKMAVMVGTGPIHEEWAERADKVSVLLEVSVDDVVILTIPASALDKSVVKKLWEAMTPSWNLPGPQRKLEELPGYEHNK